MQIVGIEWVSEYKPRRHDRGFELVGCCVCFHCLITSCQETLRHHKLHKMAGGVELSRSCRWAAYNIKLGNLLWGRGHGGGGGRHVLIKSRGGERWGGGEGLKRLVDCPQRLPEPPFMAPSEIPQNDLPLWALVLPSLRAIRGSSTHFGTHPCHPKTKKHTHLNGVMEVLSKLYHKLAQFLSV